MGGQKAECGVAGDDGFHGKGLGTLLLERLAVLAARQGFTKFWAVTHADNRPMIEVFENSGFETKEQMKEGYVEVELSVIPGEAFIARSEMRDRLATSASLRPFFRPKSVAVIGASRDSGRLGYRIVDALMKSQFQGSVFPINPKADRILGLPAYPGVRELTQEVDLAIIAVPREAVS